MNNRLGFVGIIVDDRANVAATVNQVISDYGEIIIARLGVPYREKDCSVITLIVDTTNDRLGEFTGKVGAIDGVSVKSALAKS